MNKWLFVYWHKNRNIGKKETIVVVLKSTSEWTIWGVAKLIENLGWFFIDRMDHFNIGIRKKNEKSYVTFSDSFIGNYLDADCFIKYLR